MSSEIPRPKTWEEFEHIALDSLRIKWGSPNLVRNGRHGQKQDGVDIYGPDHLEQDVGVQCKNTFDNLTLDIIKTEVEMAEAFEPSLAVLYIATTFPNDAKLQNSIRLFSAERIKVKKFPVGIFFWEDIVRDLVKSPECIRLHYPYLNPVAYQDSAVKGFRHLAIYDCCFYGLYLRRYFALIFGEVGQIAGEDPRGFRSILRTLEGCSTALFSEDRQKELLAVIHKLTERLFTDKKIEHNVMALCREIEDITNTLQHALTGSEQAVYRLGELIGRWEAVDLPEAIDPGDQHRLISWTEATLQGRVPEWVRTAITSPKSERGSRISSRISDAIRTCIIDRGIKG